MNEIPLRTIIIMCLYLIVNVESGESRTTEELCQQCLLGSKRLDSEKNEVGLANEKSNQQFDTHEVKKENLEKNDVETVEMFRTMTTSLPTTTTTELDDNDVDYDVDQYADGNVANLTDFESNYGDDEKPIPMCKMNEICGWKTYNQQTGCPESFIWTTNCNCSKNTHSCVRDEFVSRKYSFKYVCIEDDFVTKDQKLAPLSDRNYKSYRCPLN